MRATTSGGVAMTSLARTSISSPGVGSISSLRLSASARKAGSLNVLSNDSRKTLILSGGTPGGATIGRPRSPDAKNYFGQRSSRASLVLYRSINS